METTKKILFFDDEPFISNVLVENLTKNYGWDISLVTNANDLFLNLNNDSILYDLIIMDIMAPIPDLENSSIVFSPKDIHDMSKGLTTGIIFALKIWEIKKYNNIHIMFLSAKNNSFLAQNTRIKRDCVSYIRKPELARKIDKKLHKLLDNK